MALLNIKDTSNVVTELPGGNNVKKLMEPGIRKICIKDFEVKEFRTGSIQVIALCETEPLEEIGDKGFDYEGLSGKGKAKGQLGRIALNEYPFQPDQADKLQQISNDIIHFGTIMDVMDELEKGEVETTGDTLKDLKAELKAYGKVLKDNYFYSVIITKQFINSKGYPSDSLAFREFGKKQSDGTILVTAASAHSLESVAKVDVFEDEATTGFNLEDINGKIVSTWRKNKDKSDTWDFKFPEQPDEEEENEENPLDDIPDVDLTEL